MNENKLYVTTDCQDDETVTNTYSAALPASEWTHIAVVWNAGTMKMSMVINGVSQMVFEYKAEPVNFWTDWTDKEYTLDDDGSRVGSYIEHRTYSMSLFMNEAAWADDVRVDEVRIWSVARDINDIFAQHDTLVGVNERGEGLMRCYRFDDGGETIEDFAHPGWENFGSYAINPGVADWFDTNAAAIYGMDDINTNGMPDWFETYYGVTDAAGDEDGDGLVNLYEYLCGTDPTDKTNETADFDAAAPAGDGLTNGQKQQFGLDPRLADSDGDGISDADEVNGTADTFPATKEADEVVEPASDPLNPLNNKKPDLNPLKHFEFTGAAEGMLLKANSKYAQESWTVMAWVKTDSVDQTAAIIKRQTSSNGISYELGLANGIPYVKYTTKNGSPVQAPADPTIATKLQLKAGEWTHLAGSFDNETGVLRLFLNGMPVAEKVEEKKRAELYGSGVIDGTLTGEQVTLGQGYTGSMDAVQFYDNALAGAVISDIYNTMESGAMGIAEPYYAAGEETEGVDTVNMTMSIDDLLAADHQPSQLLVKFNSSVSEEMIQRAHSILGTKTLKKYPITGIYLIEVPKNLDLKTGIEKLRKMNAIEFVEPNYKFDLSAVPNDPSFNELWGMKNSSHPGIDIGATEAWDISTGSNKVIVAVIDSGVDYNHPDLAANMWVNTREIPDNGIDDDNNGYVDDYYGYDFGDGDSDPGPGNYHGTHVAGTIGAVGNNGKGVVGVNWNVKLMALKCGIGDGRSLVDATEAYEYAMAMGANVINCSFGGSYYSASQHRALLEAQKKGILVVCAAGNSSEDNDVTPHYPSSYELDNIVAVASMDSNGSPSYFTCYGKTSVDIAAPGGNILSTMPNGEYDFLDGTSMACPHVAGMAAWLKGKYPKATYKMLREALLKGSVTSSEWKNLIATGAYTTLPRANAVLAKGSGSRNFASGLIAAFRGNAVFDGMVLDLTETELGAAAAGQYEAAPTVGRYASELVNCTAEETDKADYATFIGDSDGDGMPDWYEVQVSLNPNEADGDIDSDKDGLTNYYEYLAGTSPWNAMTDGSTRDNELPMAFGDLKYEDGQRLGVHPKAETDGYADYDTDDDGATDKDESGFGDATKTGRADDSLTQYKNLVLKLAGTAGSYLLLPNQARYVLSDNWALDLWIKIDPALEGDAVLIKRTIDTKAAGNDSDTLINYELGIKKSENLWRPYVTFTVMDGTSKVTRTCESYNGIASDVWAHIGAIFRSAAAEDDETAGEASLSVLINNEVSNTTECNGIRMNGDAVGISEVRVGEGFLGKLDAVRFWAAARDDFSDFKDAAENAISDYVPNGLMASFIFDDGGETAQNFAVAQDDWKEGWLNAAKLVAVDGGTIEMVSEDTNSSPVAGEEKDSDGDGLPDWWELYYGLDPNDSTGDNGADGDPDGDGLS
ncbi:MAG: S8 family serine peptidase, partial [Victivallales bacterium]|nr:S8 family serine peptidase [Victivallales bacterium]